MASNEARGQKNLDVDGNGPSNAANRPCHAKNFIRLSQDDDEDDDEILLDGGGGFVVFVGESDLSCRGARRKPLPPLLSIVAATAI